MGTLKSRGLLALLILGTAAQGGCVTKWLGMGGEPRVEGSKGTISLAKLERLLDSFAERDVTLVADACDAIKRQALSEEEARLAHHLKLANATAVFDIVSQPQILGRMADLYVLIELQHLVWVTEGGADRKFDDAGRDRLIASMLESRRGMSRIADLAMKPDRRSRFDAMIRNWRDRNPDVEFVAGIRFGALPEAQGKSILESASSFFDVINPMEDTGESVERARLLADRAFYYAKRLPRLIDWQAEAALGDTMAKPEVRGLLDRSERITASAERISRTIQELPQRVAEEREEILAAWDARSDKVHGTILDARELAVRATEAGNAFAQTFRELQELTGRNRRDPNDPPRRPFDIREYTEAAAQLRELSRETAGITEGVKDLVDHVVWRVVGIVALFFLLLLLYRLVSVRWIRPASAPAWNGPARRPPTTLETRYGSPT